MCVTPDHIEWLVDTGERLTTVDGKVVEIWEFQHQPDEDALSAWACHFRNHYCRDDEIDYFRRGYRFSRADFLNNIKFPDPKDPPGPSVRAGDFGEILIADYLQYILGYWVPRARYGAKVIGNESSKGCDTLGFFILTEGEESPEDTLAVYEAKARLTSDHLTEGRRFSGFQTAINDSAKDNTRIAESLNYLKQRLFDKNMLEKAEKIERFQNPDDHPYTKKYGAAVIFSNHSYIPETIDAADTSYHPDKDRLFLIVICGEQLMDLVHSLYQRAADEA